MRVRVTLAVLATLAFAGVALASPPELAPEPAPVDPAAAISGYWLSLELIGPRGAQIDAARSLVRPPVVDALPRGGAPPPGELVGHVDTLAQALEWVSQHAFTGGAVGFEDNGDQRPAPLPGAALLDGYGVHLTALVVTGEGPSGGTVPYPWPPAAVLAAPSDAWLPASLAVARAPLFAAPGAALPPASERYQTVELGDAIWQLGALDRCTPAGACLRWAQVLVRRGDRFFGGWLPAALVIADREWVGGPNERRFALLASHRDRDEVTYVLVEQRGDRREPPRSVSQTRAAPRWPSASVQVVGEQLIAMIDGRPELTLELPPIPAPTL